MVCFIRLIIITFLCFCYSSLAIACTPDLEGINEAEEKRSYEIIMKELKLKKEDIELSFLENYALAFINTDGALDCHDQNYSTYRFFLTDDRIYDVYVASGVNIEHKLTERFIDKIEGYEKFKSNDEFIALYKFYKAIDDGNLELVKSSLASQINIDKALPLKIFSKFRNFPITYYTDLSPRRNLLDFAIIKNNVGIVKELVAYGINVNSHRKIPVNEGGYTKQSPLINAIYNLMYDSRVYLSVEDAEMYKSGVYAEMFKHRGPYNLDIIKFLIENGAIIDDSINKLIEYFAVDAKDGSLMTIGIPNVLTGSSVEDKLPKLMFELMKYLHSKGAVIEPIRESFEEDYLRIINENKKIK